ncbi:transmembrane protein, putative [Medicago truncatula]|uniref:Transmembrane protein, putative n=1 Tax=Medicago truncatula TaxID=3880 RepID=A0A072U8X5_MEDTR|nr:transmembrane protein, putative [Medicago truncatula]
MERQKGRERVRDGGFRHHLEGSFHRYSSSSEVRLIEVRKDNRRARGKEAGMVQGLGSLGLGTVLVRIGITDFPTQLPLFHLMKGFEISFTRDNLFKSLRDTKY